MRPAIPNGNIFFPGGDSLPLRLRFAFSGRGGGRDVNEFHPVVFELHAKAYLK